MEDRYTVLIGLFCGLARFMPIKHCGTLDNNIGREGVPQTLQDMTYVPTPLEDFSVTNTVY